MFAYAPNGYYPVVIGIMSGYISGAEVDDVNAGGKHMTDFDRLWRADLPGACNAIADQVVLNLFSCRAMEVNCLISLGLARCFISRSICKFRVIARNAV